MGNVAADQLAWPRSTAVQWRSTAFFGGLGPEGAALTAAMSLRTDEAPADELMDSRLRHDRAEVRADLHDIGEYVAMCCFKNNIYLKNS